MSYGVRMRAVHVLPDAQGNPGPSIKAQRIRRSALWATLLLACVASAGSKEGNLVAAISDGNVSAVKALLHAGAKLDDRDEIDGNTILHRALAELDAERRLGAYPEEELEQLKDRQMQALRLLIKGGAPLEARNNSGATPLIFAAGNGGNVTQSPEQIAAVKLLLEMGAQVNATDKMRDTALHLAARRGYIESIKLLLAHGADPALKNMYGETAQKMAEPGEGHSDLDQSIRHQTIDLLKGKGK